MWQCVSGRALVMRDQATRIEAGVVGCGVTNSNNTEALARRLVACPHFRVLPGMRLCKIGIVDDSFIWRWGDGADADYPPDLDDRLTRLAVLVLVRDAWCDQAISVVEDVMSESHTVWRVHSGRPGLRNVACRTELEVLVAALEAAPVR